ncbi:hypothetical protein FRB97_005117 [Tulasnella sp. 331]|nr:hypothetical protein FRB97_005117 [Tulasnella sp. 331]KAG8890191.1 hypothetical protein FRB98_000519 [Tulasnella sp. 332]
MGLVFHAYSPPATHASTLVAKDLNQGGANGFTRQGTGQGPATLENPNVDPYATAQESPSARPEDSPTPSSSTDHASRPVGVKANATPAQSHGTLGDAIGGTTLYGPRAGVTSTTDNSNPINGNMAGVIAATALSIVGTGSGEGQDTTSSVDS